MEEIDKLFLTTESTHRPGGSVPGEHTEFFSFLQSVIDRLDNGWLYGGRVGPGGFPSPYRDHTSKKIRHRYPPRVSTRFAWQIVHLDQRMLLVSIHQFTIYFYGRIIPACQSVINPAFMIARGTCESKALDRRSGLACPHLVDRMCFRSKPPAEGMAKQTGPPRSARTVAGPSLLQLETEPALRPVL